MNMEALEINMKSLLEAARKEGIRDAIKAIKAVQAMVTSEEADGYTEGLEDAILGIEQDEAARDFLIAEQQAG